jgi:hypothetical protein
MGVISGTISNGTRGAELPPLQVQLITIPREGALTAQQTVTVNGAFRFEARADASLTYLIRTEHAGVPYLDEAPLLISPELPTAHRDLVVWETTTERPPLRIEQTTLLVQRVDRASGSIELRREDRVVHDGDRVWVGDASGVTWRVPTPDRLDGVQAQQAYDGETGVDGQTVTSTRPVRPGVTTFVADMVAGYDLAADGYRLRVTAPLPTDAIEIWVPERFVPDVNTDGDRSTEERDGEQWHIVRLQGVTEGESLVVGLDRLSGRQSDNPLATMTGAAAGSALAFVVLAGGVGLLWRFRARPAPMPAEAAQ